MNLTDRIELLDSYSSLFSIDTYTTDETKITPNSLRWMTIRNTCMDKFGHIDNLKQFFTGGSASLEGIGFGMQWSAVYTGTFYPAFRLSVLLSYKYLY